MRLEVEYLPLKELQNFISTIIRNLIILKVEFTLKLY